MILRSVMKHVKDQNWVAVCLDFFIVVVGVFIGIQLGNWNEACATRAQEASYLREVKAEIFRNLDQVAAQKNFVGAVLNGGERSLTYLTAQAPCENACADLLIDFFHASQLWGTGYIRTKFNEVERLGWPSNEATKREIQSFYDFVDGWDAVNGTAPVFREQFRGHLSPALARALWKGCYSLVNGSTETLSRDCVSDIDEAAAAAVLRRLLGEPSLANNLRYWLGQNISAFDFYPSMARQGMTAIAAIDRDVGDAP